MKEMSRRETRQREEHGKEIEELEKEKEDARKGKESK